MDLVKRYVSFKAAFQKFLVPVAVWEKNDIDHKGSKYRVVVILLPLGAKV